MRENGEKEKPDPLGLRDLEIKPSALSNYYEEARQNCAARAALSFERDGRVPRSRELADSWAGLAPHPLNDASMPS